MDLDSLALLHSPEGTAALTEATTLAPSEQTYLMCFGRLSKRFSPALARAALGTVLLRHRASEKFSRADRMFFERTALEQSTAEVVARHRARRFSGYRSVADWCCGLGGDAIALADQVAEVVCVDRDPLRLALATLNLRAYDQEPSLLQDDVLTMPLPPVEAVFVDPDRRPDGRRQLSLRACQPGLAEIQARLSALPWAAKVAPGVSWDELATLNAEAEFVSLRGELKECVLWFGALRGPRRRATVLPACATLSADTPAASPGTGPPLAYLYDPDPAVLRAGLVTDLAAMLGARQLDADIAYLTADQLTPGPFAWASAVEMAMPFHLKRLREWLRQRHVGRVSVSRRGSPIDPDDLVRKLKLTGDVSRSLVLTRVEGQPWVLVLAETSTPAP